MMNYTLNKDTLKIEYIAKKDKKKFYLDRRRVQQVILNLLSNATKFQETGIISVFSNIVRDGVDNTFLEITVRDEGLGMSDEAAQKAFEPFNKIDK